ncbi:MAG: peptidoglycan-associated lipoprotein Pal [Nitrosomonadales bacterium]
MMKKLMMSLVLVNLLAACASEPQKDATPTAKAVEHPDSGAAAGGANGGSGGGASGGSSTGSAGSSAGDATAGSAAAKVVDPLNDPNSILAKRSVYYPFDVSAVQDADKPIVEAHAQYLSSHPDSKVQLEGNCDERGSDEYNLALGQRRADGVKKLLVAAGAQDSQIKTVSYGEEKPRATGHDEASWSQNRRTDLNYNAQ